MNQAAAINKQSNLTEYFDVSAGMGAFVPRKRQVYTSKRLQDVVADFRKRQKPDSSTSAPESMEESRRSETDDDDVDEYNEGSRKKRKTGQRGRGVKNKGSTIASNGKRAKGKRGTRKSSKKTKEVDSEDESPVNSDDEVHESTLSAVQLRPRPRPRPVYKAKSVVGDANEQNNDSD